MSIDAINTSSQMMPGLQRPDPSEIASNVIQKKDADGDGVLSIDEMGKIADKFTEIDADGDGLVTEDEILSDLASRLEERGLIPPMNGEKPNINQLKSMLSQMGISNSDDEDTTYDTISTLLDNMGVSKEESTNIMETLQSNGLSIFS